MTKLTMIRLVIRKPVNLLGAAMFLVLIAGNSFAQKTFQLSAPARRACAADYDRTPPLGEKGSADARSSKVRFTLLPSDSSQLSRCSFFTLARSHAKSTNRGLGSQPQFTGPISSYSLTAEARSQPGRANETTAEETQGQAQPQGGDEAQELAKKLSNPVASLISFPMQSNFDFRMGTGSGWRYTLNVQPVIPIALSPKWNMISRTIVPIIHQGNVTGPGTSQTGLGDITQSLFFSPNKSEPFVWAVGPVFLIPTATDASLGSQKLGLGPTALALKQKKGWTYGMLANHIWSVAGKSNRAEVNSTYLQPFLSYTNRQAWTYSLNTESSYDWNGHSWSIPINPFISKLVRFGKQPISFGGGLRCWATTPTGGPEGCGLRIVVTALFPKK